MTERRAVAAGAELEMPIEEQFWGERYGVIRDPFGHRWACTRREQLAPDDVARRTADRLS
jgi:PhnB protein